MHATSEKFSAHLTPAGDPNGHQFVVELPAEAVDVLVKQQAFALASALAQIDATIDDDPLADLDVERLFDIEGELQRALTAVAVLLKARPGGEWGDDG